MSRLFRTLVSANFHTWEIAELYSNADRKAPPATPPGRQSAYRDPRGRRRQVLCISKRLAEPQYREPVRPDRHSRIRGRRGHLCGVQVGDAGLRDAQSVPATDGGTINYAGVDSVFFGPSTARLRCTPRCRAAQRQRRPQLRGRRRHAAYARGHCRRVLQPVAAPLLHQQPAARHRRPGLRQDRRMAARAFRSTCLPTRRGTESRLPVLHSSSSRRFALLPRIRSSARASRA